MSLETPIANRETTPPGASDLGPTEEPAPRRPRRLLWSVLAIALVLVLGLTPPLLNVNRLRRRIAASMSASIGRPVHLDSVTLHLLPVPAFTLTNLVVSEDPAFGNEPMIRAMTVEATLRPSSLWRQQVEFSTVRFVDPSLNLVRNAQGQWNLQSLLMHAAQVDTAPTAQRGAGPEPRFPYIEATGARVNLKLGEEKQPFSLTDADFALWLPSPQQWRVRLQAIPARTDRNIGDPGAVRMEGTLERAATMAAVPIDLSASWRDAPLGEASKLLMGVDAGWRGTLDIDAALSGTLGAARLTTGIHINDLRRADFIPPRLLDLDVDCNGDLAATEALIDNPECMLRSPRISAIADSIDLSELDQPGRGANGVRVGSPKLPEGWLFDVARLFSGRIPAGELGAGDLAGSVTYVPASAAGISGNQAGPSFWQGSLHGDFRPLFRQGAAQEQGAAQQSATAEQFSAVSGPAGAMLAPLDLMPPGKPPLLLSGVVSRTGYVLNLKGSATSGQIRTLRNMAPPLTDGLESALGLPVVASSTASTAEAKPLAVDVTCTRTWGAAQTCSQAAPAPVKKSHHRRRR